MAFGCKAQPVNSVNHIPCRVNLTSNNKTIQSLCSFSSFCIQKCLRYNFQVGILLHVIVYMYVFLCMAKKPSRLVKGLRSISLKIMLVWYLIKKLVLSFVSIYSSAFFSFSMNLFLFVHVVLKIYHFPSWNPTNVRCVT